MTDKIQRYNDAGYRHNYGDWIKANDFSKYKDDQIEAMEAKDKTIQAQAKEIERLKLGLIAALAGFEADQYLTDEDRQEIKELKELTK